MTLLAAVLALWRVGAEIPSAIQAAEEASGGGPLAALRAFADATPGRLDDEAVAALEAGIDGLLRLLDVLVDVGARLPIVPMHELADRMAEVGYQAGRLRHLLTQWRR